MKLLEKKNVLIVETDNQILKAVSTILERLGAADIFNTDNNAKALTLLKEKKIDLILSDCEMPLLNGIKLLESVKDDPALKDKKFIMIAGTVQKETVLQAAKLGVDDYIVKPVRVDILGDKIKNCLDDTNGLRMDLYHLEIGDISQEQGDVDIAIRRYRESLKINPENFETHYSMGEAQQKKGNLGEALISLKKSIQLNDRSAKSYYSKSRVHIGLHQQSEARNEFEVAIELDPKDLKRCKNVAQAFLERGYVEDASSAFKVAVDMDPNDVILYNKMGIALRKSGKADKAIEQYKKALSIKPGDPTILFNMSKAYISNREPSKAKKVLQEILKETSDFKEAKRLLFSL